MGNKCLKESERAEIIDEIKEYAEYYNKEIFEKDIKNAAENKEDNKVEYICTAAFQSYYFPLRSMIQLDSERIIISTDGPEIRIWNIKSNIPTVIKNIDIEKDNIIKSICLLSYNNTDDYTQILAFASSNPKIKLWNLNTFEYISTIDAHTKPITYLHQLPTKSLASSSQDFTIKIWSIPTFTCLQIINSYYITQILSVIQVTCLAACDLNGTVIFWDTSTWEEQGKLQGHTRQVTKVIDLQNGSIATCSQDRTVRVWDSKTYQCCTVAKGHCGPIQNMIQLTDGRIVTCGSHLTIRFWDWKSMKCLFYLREHKGEVNDVIELKDGRLASCSGMAFGGKEYSLKIWRRNPMI